MTRRKFQISMMRLACIALALILFAPAVSRTLALLHPTSALSVVMPMDCGRPVAPMAGMDHSDRSAPSSPMAGMARPNEPGVPAPMDDACGYCSLMCHHPALALVGALTVPPFHQPTTVPAFEATVAAQRPVLDRRARGPPAV